MSFWTSPPAIVLGSHGLWGLSKVKLRGHDISTHKHVIGLTGMGKSKMLASIYLQLVEQGIGASLIDPHSDLAEEVLALADARGILDRIRYVEFARRDAYLPFNVLRQPYDDGAVALNIVETFQRAWPALAGGAAPHFENMLKASAIVLIQNGLPITQMPRLLTDRAYRDMSLRNVTDPEVIYYYKYRFDHWGRETADKVESTLNKIFNLTFSKGLRYTLGQSTSALEFRGIIDSGTNMIYDLGGLDGDTQTFLGCLLTVGYEQAALSRSLGPSSRREHHLLVDEFSRFSTKSEKALTTMLSQTRKFGLFSTMAHQNFGADDEDLRRSLGNAVRIAFKVNREDALWLAPQLASYEPHQVKHEVEDPHAQERVHPQFFGVGEQYEGMAVELAKHLAPREAYVKIGSHVTKFRTLTVPTPTIDPVAFQGIKDVQARRLMTPASDVIALVDRPIERRGPPPAIS